MQVSQEVTHATMQEAATHDVLLNFFSKLLAFQHVNLQNAQLGQRPELLMHIGSLRQIKAWSHASVQGLTLMGAVNLWVVWTSSLIMRGAQVCLSVPLWLTATLTNVMKIERTIFTHVARVS